MTLHEVHPRGICHLDAMTAEQITLDVEAGAALRLDGETLGTAPLPEPLFGASARL
jgi:hypothetical protein